MNMEPAEMVRLWNAAIVLKAILTLAVMATGAALSVMVQDEVGDKLGPWICQFVDRHARWFR